MMRYLSLFIGLMCLAACSYEIPETSEPDDRFGDEDFTGFYVIGDGFSAGLMDGVLTSESQPYSYPALIGGKINTYFKTELFRQADVGTDLGLNLFEDGSKGQYILFYRSSGDEIPARRTAESEIPSDFTGDTEALRDFSFPGLRSYNVEDQAGTIDNFYLDRLGLGGQQSVLDAVTDRDPSVVLISLGYDDLLPYVLGSATGSTGLPKDEISNNDATPVSLFESSLRSIADRLHNDANASLILSTVPDPLLTPAFTTISYSMELGIEITGGEIGQLNSFYREFNERAFDYNLGDTVTTEYERPFIDFDADGGDRLRARVILDPTLPEVVFEDGYELPKIRQMTEDEYLPYRLEQVFHDNPDYGKTLPIQPQDVITSEGAEGIRQLRDSYNAVLRDLASSSENIHLLDIEQLVSELFAGEVRERGVFFNAAFSRGSLFSADGLFLNPKGNALVAQRLTELLNREYDVELLPLDVNSYPGISFEQDF